MKIWHQSMTDLSKLQQYKNNIENHANSIFNNDVTVVAHGVPAGLYKNIAPVEFLKYHYMEYLCKRIVCEAALAAEREGFDAMTIGCYLDTGLKLARSLVDIPVLGITETSMLLSCTLGDKFSIITITPSMKEHLMESAKEYGLDKRVASIITIDPPINEFDMESDTGKNVENLFKNSCEKVIKDGADVIIPGEGVLNEFLFKKNIKEYRGVPILDGNAALWQYAVMLSNLQKCSGLTVSRRYTYAKVPQELLYNLNNLHNMANLGDSDFS
jgi:allantoin racemase